jgi:phenylalanyl-tRNA synthetase beta chain
MKFSYSWLQSFFDKKLPSPEKLADILTEKIFETEVSKKGVLEVDVLPNRAAECLSYQGLAREIGAILNQPIKKLDYYSRKKGGEERWKVEIENFEDCSSYSLRLIEGIKIGSSVPWIKKRLQDSGLRPINNIVDLANYVMLETGQPLHAFDPEKLAGQKLIVRRARKGEKIKTLKGKVFNLDKEFLVIADEKEPVALAGVRGGKKAEITSTTQAILLEAANFSRSPIRNVWKKIGLRTDASWRFENGLDINLLQEAQDRFAYLVSSLYKAQPKEVVFNSCFRSKKLKEIKFEPKLVEKIVGSTITEKEISSILKRLGFGIKREKKEAWKLTIPSWRLDINQPIDLVEEVVRIYGYEKIPARPSLANLIPPVCNWNRYWAGKVKTILSQLGFNEVYNYSFIEEKQRKFFDYSLDKIVAIANPVSKRQAYLRPNLLSNLLRASGENRKHHLSVKLFELGNIFLKEKSKLQEKTNLAGILLTSDGEKGFFQLKGVVEHLIHRLMISDLWWDNYQPRVEDSFGDLWRLSQLAEIKIGDETIGLLGEINPNLAKEEKISEAVLAFEIDFSKLAKLASEEQEYRPISSQPIAKRDLSVIVPLFVSSESVIKNIYRTGGKLVRDVDLKEIYQGTSIPQEKKSLNLRIYFQAIDRTLKAKEIESIKKKIIASLKKRGWMIRN